MVCKPGQVEDVRYDSNRWSLLRKLRLEAINLMKPLIKRGFKPYVYGSLARGDVKKDSDIDIILLEPVNPVIIESIYMMDGFEICKKVIVQATPTYTPKLYIWFDIDGLKLVSMPLRSLKSREAEFYKFGGLVDYNGLISGCRVPGVDKRLILIKPTDYGHYGECIIGREGYVARLLGISEAIVKERVMILSRRDEFGRTGVFLEYSLEPEVDTLEAIHNLKKINKHFRRALEQN